MKISYNWLKEFIDLKLSPEETAEKLTLIGLEVEEIENYGSSLEGVIVGRVTGVREHPNADRLKVCDVDLGEKQVQIVCGADNVAKGQNVPVATVGTTLPLTTENGKPFTIRKAKLRGEKSEGMICAEDELGLGTDHSGIMVLDEQLEAGTPFNQVFDLYQDTIIDIAITPNRPDATCHLGVARDLAAALNLDLNYSAENAEAAEQNPDFSISIESPEKCHRYVGLLIKDVQVKESPKWLKDKLLALGLRPVNNIVDITNFVMYETGQPLHAFDFKNIRGNTITVKEFDKATEFETLDHVKRSCKSGTLFICDGKGPIAIAGVMGGLHSEVSEDTTDVLIESAYFDPVSIRKTAKAQQLQTDASYRFERGVDPAIQLKAAVRAAKLIEEYAGGSVSEPAVDIYPVKTDPVTLDLRKEYVNRLLGTDFDTAGIAGILGGLGLELLEKSDDKLIYNVPTFRPDLEREVDLIEEVGRLYDYNKIKSPETGIFVSTEPPSEHEQLLETIKKSGVELGYREIYTNSLISEEEAKRLGDLERTIPTLNPLTKDMTTLRPSLLHGFLKSTAYNFNRKIHSVRFFEVGNVFKADEKGTYFEGINEETHVLFGLSGIKYPEHWSTEEVEYSVMDLKASVQNFFIKLGLDDNINEHSDEQNQLNYNINGLEIGFLKRIDQEMCKRYGVERNVFIAEFSVDNIQKALNNSDRNPYRPVPKFPEFDFDLAVVVDQNIPVADLVKSIKKNAGQMLSSIDVFDVFEGESIGKNKKSIAFRMNFLNRNKTLNIKDVEPIIEKVLKALEKQYSAKLRG